MTGGFFHIFDDRTRPSPSETSGEDASKRPASYWQESADYWRMQAESMKHRFRMLPFVGLVGVDRLLWIKGKIAWKRAATGYSGGEVPRPGLPPEEKSRAWHARALYYETRARSYGRFVGLFSRPPLCWLDEIWRRVYVLPRLEATKRLLESCEAVPKETPATGPDLISVITPTYNRAHTLARAINSLLGQTYGNWELIVVDDGSSDGTRELVERYADKRIRYIRIEHAGVSRARNVGLDAASGKYVCFLDSDNILDPRFLETMQHAASSAPGEIGVCYCDCTVYLDGYPTEEMSQPVTAASLFNKSQIDLGTIICRAEMFADGLRFDEEMHV